MYLPQNLLCRKSTVTGNLNYLQVLNCRFRLFFIWKILKRIPLTTRSELDLEMFDISKLYSVIFIDYIYEFSKEIMTLKYQYNTKKYCVGIQRVLSLDDSTFF